MGGEGVGMIGISSLPLPSLQRGVAVTGSAYRDSYQRTGWGKALSS